MSTPLGQEVPYYVGKNDLDTLLWDGANIIDAEREQQDGIPYLGYRVEWEDNEQRHCELTGRTVADKKAIKDPDGNYGHVIHRFTRRDFRDNSEHVYIIRSKDGTIEQRDARLRMLAKPERMARPALIASIAESYDAYPHTEILQSVPDYRPDVSEEQLFNEIVHHYRKDNIIRQMGQKIRHLFSSDDT